ncbi:MAG: PEP-CTERM sorting domain-containing protein [Planctomycetes bacterium]|nr:PEP-CTERM sorting domain-containing protein [Planctomycetota bacterium]
MKKLLSILVLVVLAAPASADVTLALQDPAWDTFLVYDFDLDDFISYDCMYIDLVISDLGVHGLETNTEKIGGFGARLNLTGADAARFTGIGDVLRYSKSAAMATAVAPDTYAWTRTYYPGSNGFTQGVLSEGAAGYVTFGHNAADQTELVRFRDLQVGDVVARFVFVDSNYMSAITDLQFSLQSYAAIYDAAVFTLSDGTSEVYGYLEVIPEPATMGLLGLGLLGLVTRRKK